MRHAGQCARCRERPSRADSRLGRGPRRRGSSAPPLRARREDVAALTEFFLERICHRLNKPTPELEEQTRGLLRTYQWPGNVRELENEVERLAILCEPDGTITPGMLSERIRLNQSDIEGDSSLKEQLAQLEKSLILNALRRHQNNKSHAADELGITRQTIISKLKQYEKR